MQDDPAERRDMQNDLNDNPPKNPTQQQKRDDAADFCKPFKVIGAKKRANWPIRFVSAPTIHNLKRRRKRRNGLTR